MHLLKKRQQKKLLLKRRQQKKQQKKQYSKHDIIILTFSQVGIGLTTWTKTGKPVLQLYPDRLPDSVVNRYPGVYVFSGNDTALIEKKFGSLLLLTHGNKKKSFVATSNNSFSSIDDNVSIEFQTANGQVDGLLMFEGKKKRTANKVVSSKK